MEENLRRAKIEGFSNYDFLETAAVYNIKRGHFMRDHSDYKDGYRKLKITSDKGERVHYFMHRLMWMAFYGSIPEKMEVDHIDGERANNNIENLRLLTHKRNQFFKTQRDSNFLFNTKRKQKGKKDNDHRELF
jgi:hypothetical protein